MKEIINRISNTDITQGLSGQIIWESPSNIALIKYWGKKDFQIPSNPSLSFTLKNSFTITQLSYLVNKDLNEFSLDFEFEGRENRKFEARIRKYLKMLAGLFPFLNNIAFTVSSRNTFPHSAGIASSASSLSSLALCLASMIQNIDNDIFTGQNFFRFASLIARLGSGSASRSVYGGFVTWGAVMGLEGTSDDFASPVHAEIHPEFRDICDAVLIVDSKEKKVSSSAGHQLMEAHPFASARFNQARANLSPLLKSLGNGDFKTFAEITENEAMTLHSLMMSSSPGFLLMKPATLDIIRKIMKVRLETGLEICFTLDAGPNVHLIYKLKERDEVLRFIRKDLLDLCEDKQWIDDRIGEGPKLTGNE